MKRKIDRTFQIDVDALRAELGKRGICLAKASEEMGHCESYLNNKFIGGADERK